MAYLSAKVQFIIDICHYITLKGVKQGEFREEMTIFATCFKAIINKRQYKYYYERATRN